MKLIPLTQGKVALVDDEDYERVMQFKWYAWNNKTRSQFYAARHIRLPDGRQRLQYLHNFLLGVKGIDHRDGDGLNDLRENLRPATNQQNQFARIRKRSGATSKFRGVSWWAARNKYVASIRILGRTIGMRHFDRELDAAHHYDMLARKHCGEFASPNFSV